MFTPKRWTRGHSNGMTETITQTDSDWYVAKLFGPNTPQIGQGEGSSFDTAAMVTQAQLAHGGHACTGSCSSWEEVVAD